FLTPLFGAVLIVLSRYWVDATVSRNRWAIGVMTGSMAAITALCYAYHMLSLIPPIVLAYGVLFLRHRHTQPNRKRMRALVMAVGLYAVAAILSTVVYLPRSWVLLVVFSLVLAIVALNGQFYVFLAERRGGVFAVAAIPFHLLYHFYNGVSFGIGVARYLWKSAFASKRTPSWTGREHRS
ncbi:MAG TPA: hypothetical protein VKE70_33000, partial [Candidatus Solibacter sp.]|nr:hypothetical protein [Candidatus Solibacter sp.]